MIPPDFPVLQLDFCPTMDPKLGQAPGLPWDTQLGVELPCGVRSWPGEVGALSCLGWGRASRFYPALCSAVR